MGSIGCQSEGLCPPSSYSSMLLHVLLCNHLQALKVSTRLVGLGMSVLKMTSPRPFQRCICLPCAEECSIQSDTHRVPLAMHVRSTVAFNILVWAAILPKARTLPRRKGLYCCCGLPWCSSACVVRAHCPQTAPGC